MSYSFCFGPSGSGKSQYLRKWMIEEAGRSLSSPGQGRARYIFLVPEQYTMQTQRELVMDHPAKVLMNIDVLSFGRLAYRVFEETGMDRRSVLDDIGKSLLLRRVASRCAGDLQILQRGIRRPGMIDEMKSVLSEFMQYGIDEARIAGMADYAGDHGQPALRARLLDMQKLYAAFRQAEGDLYITSEETLDLLARAIPHAGSLQGSVLVFDGFTGFTAVQYRVVLALMRCAQKVVFSLTASLDQGPDMAVTAGGGPAGRRQDLFYLSRKTVRDLAGMAGEAGVRKDADIFLPRDAGNRFAGGGPAGSFAGRAPAGEGPFYGLREGEAARSRDDGRNGRGGSAAEAFAARALPRFGKNRVLAHLERHLFRYPEVPFVEEAPGETCRGIRLFVATTPQEEVRQILAKIRAAIAETGCAYRDFAIVTADLETYGDLFALEAARAGIPVYVDRTSRAFHNILIEGIRAALQVASESFSYDAVFRYLRSGLSRLTEDQADLLENYCLANGIRGRKKWSAAFDASCEEARQLFLREIAPVVGESRRARTAAERTEDLYGFLVGVDAQGRMEDLAARFGADGDVVREKQYGQIYRAVIDLLDQVYDLAGDERMGARDYLELLEAGFSQIRLGTLPQRVDRVLVGDMERTRLTQVRQLFFAGANDGNIPRGTARGGILSDMDREFLAGGGIRLAPTPREQMFIQRLYLYINMTKPSDCLTVSFAKGSPDGRSLRPSYLISQLRALFPGLQAEFPETRSPADQVAGRADGLSILARLLRRFAEGNEDLMDLAGAQREGSVSFAREFSLVYGFFTSREVVADPQVGRRVARLRRAALYRYRPETLRPDIAKKIYGDGIRGGVSRLETAARCMLRQHLRYGLRLTERDSYEFQAVDAGTVLHAALQRFDAFLREEKTSWRAFSREDAARLAAKALEDVAARYRNLLLYKSARDQRRLDRLERRLVRTVDTLQYQIRKGDLDPVASELAFGEEGGRQESFAPGGRLLPETGGRDLFIGPAGNREGLGDFGDFRDFGDLGQDSLPAIRFDLGAGRALDLVGRIDRVDLHVQEGRQFIRIMDYKTGHLDLDQDLIRRGLQLQLITYMEALRGASLRGLAKKGGLPLLLTAAGREGGGQDALAPEAGADDGQAPGGPIGAGPGGGETLQPLPSAMLYYCMDDPVIEMTAREALQAAGEGNLAAAPFLDAQAGQIRKKLRPTGLVYLDEDSIRHLDRDFSGPSDAIPVGRKKNGDYTAASRVIGPEDYRALADDAKAAICRIANAILDGEVTAAPAVIDKTRTGCDYCPYREACGFDPRIPGYERKEG